MCTRTCVHATCTVVLSKLQAIAIPITTYNCSLSGVRESGTHTKRRKQILVVISEVTISDVHLNTVVVAKGCLCN